MKKLLMLIMAGGLSLGIVGCGCKRTERTAVKTSTGTAVKKHGTNGTIYGEPSGKKCSPTAGMNGDGKAKQETWAEKEERRLREEEAKWRQEWDKTESEREAKCKGMAPASPKTMAATDSCGCNGMMNGKDDHYVNDDMKVGTIRPQSPAMEEVAVAEPKNGNIKGNKKLGERKSECVRPETRQEKKARNAAKKSEKCAENHARVAAVDNCACKIAANPCALSATAQHRTNDDMQVGSFRPEQKRYGSSWAKRDCAVKPMKKPSERNIRYQNRAKAERQLRQKDKIEERQLSLKQQERYNDVMYKMDQNCNCCRAWWESCGRLEPFESQYLSGPEFTRGL